MLLDVLDSYFLFVQSQLTKLGATVTVNGSQIPQPLGTVVQANDWPLTPLQEGAPSLLVLNVSPRGGTPNQILYEFVCQWIWILIGTNISATQVGANRGDRYRNNMQIMQNLRQANHPGFCQKQSITAVDGNTGAITQTPASSVVPYASIPTNSMESIWWTRLRFPMRQDKDSGVVYGVATVSVFGYDNTDAIVA